MSGFTTLRDLGTEGAAYADAELKQAVEQGIVPGPRMLVVTRAIVATGYDLAILDCAPSISLVSENVFSAADLLRFDTGPVGIAELGSGHAGSPQIRALEIGIAQIGKSFRNEVTPGNFIFRTREFEQMEMEYFVKPGEDETAHQEWIDACNQWFQDIGIARANLRMYEQPKEELAHYAKRTVDIQYRFFPEREEDERQWDELMGIANRTDFDLRTHSKKPEDAEGKRLNPDSTEDLSYFDEATKERYYPYVIEPAGGPNRSMMAFLGVLTAVATRMLRLPGATAPTVLVLGWTLFLATVGWIATFPVSLSV
jgi:hypothetical protein